MRTYQITVTMLNGKQSKYCGLYGSGIDAVIDAMETHPEARRISARRLL